MNSQQRPIILLDDKTSDNNSLAEKLQFIGEHVLCLTSGNWFKDAPELDSIMCVVIEIERLGGELTQVLEKLHKEAKHLPIIMVGDSKELNGLPEELNNHIVSHLNMNSDISSWLNALHLAQLCAEDNQQERAKPERQASTPGTQTGRSRSHQTRNG